MPGGYPGSSKVGAWRFKPALKPASTLDPIGGDNNSIGGDNNPIGGDNNPIGGDHNSIIFLNFTTMKNHDWLPKNHEALYLNLTLTTGYLTGVVRTRIGLGTSTPGGAWYDGDFWSAWESHQDVYSQWQNPSTRTSFITTELQDSESKLVPLYRELYTGFIRSNPLVTNADLDGMGFPLHPSGGHTPVPVPHTMPEAEVIWPSPGVVEIHFRDAGWSRRAKPHGVHGAEICWAVLDEKPVKWDELTNSSFDTHTPFRLTFKGNQRGKWLYFSLRWENTRGEKGPWSEILETVIP
jgi:hypothetical protein